MPPTGQWPRDWRAQRVSIFRASSWLLSSCWHNQDFAKWWVLASSQAQQQVEHTSCSVSLTRASCPLHPNSQTCWYAGQTALATRWRFFSQLVFIPWLDWKPACKLVGLQHFQKQWSNCWFSACWIICQSIIWSYQFLCWYSRFEHFWAGNPTAQILQLSDLGTFLSSLMEYFLDYWCTSFHISAVTEFLFWSFGQSRLNLDAIGGNLDRCTSYEYHQTSRWNVYALIWESIAIDSALPFEHMSCSGCLVSPGLGEGLRIWEISHGQYDSQLVHLVGVSRIWSTLQHFYRKNKSMRWKQRPSWSQIACMNRYLWSANPPSSCHFSGTYQFPVGHRDWKSWRGPKSNGL